MWHIITKAWKPQNEKYIFVWVTHPSTIDKSTQSSLSDWRFRLEQQRPWTSLSGTFLCSPSRWLSTPWLRLAPGMLEGQCSRLFLLQYVCEISVFGCVYVKDFMHAVIWFTFRRCCGLCMYVFERKGSVLQKRNIYYLYMCAYMTDSPSPCSPT